MRKRTVWRKVHIYPNGFIRAGVIHNNHPHKNDVIAFEEYFENKGEKRIGYEKELYSFREMTVDEAAIKIEVLSNAIAYYMEEVKNKGRK